MYTMPMRGMQVIHITESQETNFDVAPWVFGGQALFTIVVASGVTVNSTDATLGGAIYSSVPVDPDRSKVIIRNSGTLLGCNGRGGRGSGASSSQPAQAGYTGCSGVDLSCPIFLHNISGNIVAGGGGGGGGGSGIFIAGSGGAGNPGGVFPQSNSAYDGESVQYGPGEGGPAKDSSSGKGGNCNGAGLAGSSGQSTSPSGGHDAGGAGGVAGYGLNSQGNGVTIISGAANIIGGVDLEV